jgi:hypothetical protein
MSVIATSPVVPDMTPVPAAGAVGALVIKGKSTVMTALCMADYLRLRDQVDFVQWLFRSGNFELLCHECERKKERW